MLAAADPASLLVHLRLRRVLMVAIANSQSLLQHPSSRSRRQGLAELITDASEVVRPFFLKQGWQDGPRQEVTRGGVTLHNYRMAKPLKPALERAA